MRGMDEEAKQLLREIRDLMAASPARYEKAIEENKRLYEQHLAKSKRLAIIATLIIGACMAVTLYNR
jgi:hypothetical protein